MFEGVSLWLVSVLVITISALVLVVTANESKDDKKDS